MEDDTHSGILRELLSPLAHLLEDGSIYEIVVNRPGVAWSEGANGWTMQEIPDLSFDKLLRLARAIASYSRQVVDEVRPILSATLPGNERVQIVIPPATTPGTVSVTLRKPSAVTLDLDEMEESGLFRAISQANRASVSANERLLEFHNAGRWKAFLCEAVRERKNIIISGATGSGKTTLSKALIRQISESERIITIEDAPELMVPQPNHVRLFYSKGGQGLARIAPKDLLEASLRMRPDRILLQELRDAAAFYYIRNISSGHPGSITTIHADTAKLAFEQLTLLIMESDGGRKLERGDIRTLLTLLVDVIVQCRRVDGQFRVTEIYFDPMRAGAPST